MGQDYQDVDRDGGLDYDLYRLPGLDDYVFRGPPVDLSKPFIACVGAAQTFGRFVAEPYPALLAKRLGAQVLNLGVGGVGPRFFAKPAFVSLLNRAEAVVFQVLSGRSASSSQFDNTASGALMGKTPFAPGAIRAEAYLAHAKETLSRAQFEALIAEMRADYVAQYLKLLGQITAPRLLLWLSKRRPAYQENYDGELHGVLADFPHLVNAQMVAEIAARCDDYVECASTTGVPQPLWPSRQPIAGARLRGDRLFNFYYPSPQMHAEAAEALAAPCGRFWAQADAPRAKRFVIVGPARSGTNLLVAFLNQHAGCFCGGELFNGGQIAKGRLPWYEFPAEERDRLIALRRSDPVAFLQALWQDAAAVGHAAVGFKLLYNHVQDEREVANHLAADPTICVIHVTRRNLLRQLVSLRQAQATDQWAVGRYTEIKERLPVELDLPQIMRVFASNEAHEATIAERFAGHRVLRIVYEDLAARPQSVGMRAARFLGLPPLSHPPEVFYKRTGVADLDQAVVGYAELRARARRWAAFFDE